MTTHGFAAVLNPMASPAPAVPPPHPSEPAARSPEARDFHRRLPGYQPTPLFSAPRLAERLGIGELLLKCECERFGLPAFKMLGASWAVYRALCKRLGGGAGEWRNLKELVALLEPLPPLSLAAATDGNHGRAVARMAGLLGLGARIFVPTGTSQGRIEAIEGEGADVVVVDGGYDDAVVRSAAEAGERCLVISDTSWPGYTQVPRWVIEGYATLFWEIDDALTRAGRPRPDVVVVPVGVGALAAAAVAYVAAPPPREMRSDAGSTTIIGVEPTDAACVTESVLAGHPVTLPGAQHSVMAGLNCGTPSSVAWPVVSHGVAALVTIADEWAVDAVRQLAALGVAAGETGAAALAGLTALRCADAPAAVAGLVAPDASVLALVTEGPSDPELWRRILGVELVG